MLCDLGACLDATAAHGATALHLAADENRVEVVRILCDARADVNKAAAYGATPLHMACMGGHAAVVQALCEAGADAQQAGMNGTTPLVLAALGGYVEAVQVLCSVGVFRVGVAVGKGKQHVVACRAHGQGLCADDRSKVDAMRRDRSRAPARHRKHAVIELRRKRLKVTLRLRHPRSTGKDRLWDALLRGFVEWVPPDGLRALRRWGRLRGRRPSKAPAVGRRARAVSSVTW